MPRPVNNWDKPAVAIANCRPLRLRISMLGNFAAKAAEKRRFCWNECSFGRWKGWLQLGLGGLTMKKEVQDALETAIAGFEKRQDAEQQRLREREKFETEWIRNRTVVVVPALEEIKALLSKARWQCEVRPEKDQGIHFTIYRENMKAGIGAGGSERPYMSFQPEKEKNTVLVYVATIGSGAGLGSFALDQITEDFVQAEASKFFVRLASGT